MPYKPTPCTCGCNLSIPPHLTGQTDIASERPVDTNPWVTLTPTVMYGLQHLQLYMLGCYSQDSYSRDSYRSIEEAERQGGIYEAPACVGAQVATLLLGMRTAEDCLDGGHPLAYVIRRA